MLDRILKDLIRSYRVLVPKILYIYYLLRRELLGVTSERAERRGLLTKILRPSPLYLISVTSYITNKSIRKIDI